MAKDHGYLDCLKRDKLKFHGFDGEREYLSLDSMRDAVCPECYDEFMRLTILGVSGGSPYEYVQQILRESNSNEHFK